MNSESGHWTICLECQGRGKKSKRVRKKLRLRYQRELEEFNKSNIEGIAPVRPKGHLDNCVNCKGSGLIHSNNEALSDTEQDIDTNRESDKERYPHLAIIGAGIGGMALAVACLHRKIPFTLYERDSGFDVRSQGYGLTLQQASKAIEGLGIFTLDEGVVSTRHLVHTTEGNVLGEWGNGKHEVPEALSATKRKNVHIARQSLRLALLEQLGGHDAVQWGHQLVDLKEGGSANNNGSVDLSFQIEDKNKDELIHANAGLVVGADGIRSSVRQLLIGEEAAPLRYLDCIVILGICPLADIEGLGVFQEGDAQGSPAQDSTFLNSDLLDSATVFQTANGNERIYMMPYSPDSVMWQLSFPMSEKDAKALSAQGPQALKEEACRRCQWHDPIPQVLAATKVAQVSGYPVYDRALLQPEMLAKAEQVTLIGDAAHPMSPFKGQGANQALLDALALAREITKECRLLSPWREAGIRKSVLTEFEAEMLARSATKVKGSADAAQFLHSDIVLHEGDEPRGRVLKREEENKKE